MLFGFAEDLTERIDTVVLSLPSESACGAPWFAVVVGVATGVVKREENLEAVKERLVLVAKEQKIVKVRLKRC